MLAVNAGDRLLTCQSLAGVIIDIMTFVHAVPHRGGYGVVGQGLLQVPTELSPAEARHPNKLHRENLGEESS